MGNKRRGNESGIYSEWDLTFWNIIPTVVMIRDNPIEGDREEEETLIVGESSIVAEKEDVFPRLMVLFMNS